jgi:microtubule-associated protein-like 6
VVISGSGEGNLFVWKGGSADKGIKGHDGKVSSLYMDAKTKLLYSGALDGKVVSWAYEGGTIAKKAEIVNLAKITTFPPGVVAIDMSPKTGLFLFGTNGAQIY